MDILKRIFTSRGIPLVGPSPRSTALIVYTLLLVLLCSCNIKKSDSEDDDSPPDGGGGSGAFLTFDQKSDDRGRVSINFNVPAGTNKFAVVAEADASLRFDTLENGNGASYIGRGTTLASTFVESANTASAPSRDFDPQVTDSLPYSSVITVSNSGSSPTSGRDVHVTVISKSDGNFSGGGLDVNVFFVGDIPQSQENVAAVRAGLNEMRQIYQSQAGISLRVAEINSSGPSTLPDPANGDSFYRNEARKATSPAVNIFVGGDVDVGGGRNVLGIASSIPGPPIPTALSAVAVSITSSAGPDGDFSDDDIRVFGETMAHESGHFLGLFHPVEVGLGSSVSGQDPLPDTASCGSLAGCLSNDSLIGNLMFPFPVSDGSGGTVAQDRLTSQQRGVLNRYVAVD